MLLALLLLPLAAYLAIAGALWAFQERVIFPAYLVPAAGPLPPGAERLTLSTVDGATLEGLALPAAEGEGSDLILAFVGNASNAQGVAGELAAIFPRHRIVAFHYRGYAPSTGATAAERLIEDAPRIHDLVAGRFQPRRIVAVGISLGSGVAASLAARRPLAGLILVTPFDSLGATAAQHYPWLPVRRLLRHEIDSATALQGVRTPVAIVAAGRDTTIPPQRTAALRAAIPNLVFDATIPEARHNDIPLHPRFVPAMRAAMARIEAAD
ncbi:MAG: alpha/beta hydrolase [Sphingosinicella sp.]|uniref:alpha/beta hydrolase n=1 Tax=Sphingosinicella sp. TaxID=1917971 RepID=UPI00403808A8